MSGARGNNRDFKENIVIEGFLKILQIIARNVLTRKYLGDFLNVGKPHMGHVELAGFKIFSKDLSGFIESGVFHSVLRFY